MNTEAISFTSRASLLLCLPSPGRPGVLKPRTLPLVRPDSLHHMAAALSVAVITPPLSPLARLPSTFTKTFLLQPLGQLFSPQSVFLVFLSKQLN